MYISRVYLDTRKHETAKALYDLNIFHGALEGCFTGERHHPLWRIERDANRTSIIMLSKDLPDFISLQNQFGLAGTPAETKPYDKYVESVRDDIVYRFRLVANPVVTRDGKRIPLNMNRTEKFQYCAVDWLKDRLKSIGAEVVSCDVSACKNNKISKKRHGITLYTAQFDGVLRVRDSEMVRKAMIKGIGHGKAYGCGLLTIMR